MPMRSIASAEPTSRWAIWMKRRRPTPRRSGPTPRISLRGAICRGSRFFAARVDVHPRMSRDPVPCHAPARFSRKSARPGSTSSSIPGELPLLADISSGEELHLSQEADRLVVRRANGDRVGEVEPKTGRRVMDLMASGNRYEIFALGLTGHTLRTIIREIFRDASVATTVSFPRQITSRAYLRDRDLLRQRDEADFFLFDEEDEEDEDASHLRLSATKKILLKATAR